jgi:hypothetical protein
MPLFRRNKPTSANTRTSPVSPPAREDTSFPPWALSSIYDWLVPFFQGAGPDASGYSSFGSRQHRNFLREIERNLRLTLDWRQGEQGALGSLSAHMQRDPELLVKIVDYALGNPLMGYSFQEYGPAVSELDRTLREAGSIWCVRQTPGRVECSLERRADPAAGAAVNTIANESSRDAEHLSNAWRLAYGQSPNPSEAYREAVKAVEVVAIPVVLPNDSSATLGKVIAAMRQSPTKWKSTFTRSVAGSQQQGMQHMPVEVVIQMLDLLWRNQTDRHGVTPAQPVEPITQGQAELAVNLALALVQFFRGGGVTVR